MNDNVFKDILGKEIKIGDVVAYSSGGGRGAYVKVNIGIVRRFTPKSAVLTIKGEICDYDLYMFDSDRTLILGNLYGMSSDLAEIVNDLAIHEKALNKIKEISE